MENSYSVPAHFGTLLPIHFADAIQVFHGAKYKLVQEVFIKLYKGSIGRIMCCLNMGTTLNGRHLVPFFVIFKCHGIRQVYGLVKGFCAYMFDFEWTESLKEDNPSL